MIDATCQKIMDALDVGAEVLLLEESGTLVFEFANVKACELNGRDLKVEMGKPVTEALPDISEATIDTYYGAIEGQVALPERTYQGGGFHFTLSAKPIDSSRLLVLYRRHDHLVAVGRMQKTLSKTLRELR